MKVMRSHEPGRLIFIPSNVKLLKYGENRSFPVNYRLTEEPVRVLMTIPADENKHVGIHYEGATWFVDESDITYGE